MRYVVSLSSLDSGGSLTLEEVHSYLIMSHMDPLICKWAVTVSLGQLKNVKNPLRNRKPYPSSRTLFPNTRDHHSNFDSRKEFKETSLYLSGLCSSLKIMDSLESSDQSLQDNQESWSLYGFHVLAENKQGVSVNSASINVLKGSLSSVFLPVVYIIIFIVGLPTNAMAIWVFLFRTKKKHPASILMANLALADLLFIIWLPLKISYHFNGNNWIFGEELCKVLVGFFYGNMYCSTIFITLISVQRYWALVHPLSEKISNRMTVCVCVSVWIVVWLVTTPLYLYDQTVKVLNTGIITCHDVTRPSQSNIPIGYFLTMGIVGYIIPCAVCIVAYLLIFRSLGRSITDAGNMKKKKRAIVLMITVLVMFLVCFTPSNIMLIVHYSLLAANIPNNGYGFYIITLCLSSLNSCLDPFVYYFISEEFRQNVKNTLMCRSERTAKRMKVSFSALKFSKTSSTYTSDSAHSQSTTYTSDSSHTQSNTC
ncbi:proteinase-activated receptor 2-like [Hoplias malabaricus]|uniref:proteinase-activated receptor 2-like n=1 Tax=Hoplias malabaricus TaxID=27720 RepID=UPI00346309C1